MGKYWAYMTCDSTRLSPQAWVTWVQSINFLALLWLGLGLTLVLLASSMIVKLWPRFTEVWSAAYPSVSSWDTPFSQLYKQYKIDKIHKIPKIMPFLAKISLLVSYYFVNLETRFRDNMAQFISNNFKKGTWSNQTK